MEEKIKKYISENKWFISFYLVWAFIHIGLWLAGRNSYGFWPFDGFDSKDYGGVELFVYLTMPVLIFIINKLVGKDIKQKLDENG